MKKSSGFKSNNPNNLRAEDQIEVQATWLDVRLGILRRYVLKSS